MSSAPHGGGNRIDPASATKRFVDFAFQHRVGLVETFRAWDTRVETTVIFKIFRYDVVGHAARLAKLTDEVKSLAAVTNPHLVHILHFEARDRYAFVAMEDVAGLPLLEAVTRFRFTARELVPLLAQAADGVAAAHGAGVLHRDLRPECLMVTTSGFAKVLDFGLARFVGSATLRDTTRSGYLVGTPGYVAPESYRGAPSSEVTDMFSLGVVCYQSLTGDLPYSEASMRLYALDGVALTGPVEPPSHRSAEADGELDAIVKAAVALDPAQRTASAARLAAALHEWSERRGRGRSIVESFEAAETAETADTAETAETAEPAEPAEPAAPPPAELVTTVPAPAVVSAVERPSTGQLPSAATGPDEDLATRVAGFLVIGALILPLVVNALSGLMTDRGGTTPTPAATTAIATGPTGAPTLPFGISGADLGPPIGPSASPLHSATWAGRTDTVHTLVGQRSSVDDPDGLGRTPLMVAAIRGYPAVVALLLQHGASTAVADSRGATALHYAARAGHLPAVRMLVEHGAPVTAATGVGDETPLHAACDGGRTDVAAFLLGRGADVDAVDATGATALHLAAQRGSLDLSQLLVRAGADVRRRRTDGLTAAQCAVMAGHRAVAALLSGGP